VAGTFWAPFGSLAAGVINGTDSANLIGVDPQLGALTYNGGETYSHALSTGTPAVDLGANPLALADDQRGPGFPREVADAADIGAVEAGVAVPIPALSRVGMAGTVLLLLAIGLLMLRRRQPRAVVWESALPRRGPTRPEERPREGRDAGGSAARAAAALFSARAGASRVSRHSELGRARAPAQKAAPPEARSCGTAAAKSASRGARALTGVS